MITTRYIINTSLDYDLKLAVIADLHDQDGSSVVLTLNADKPDFIVIVGDLVDRASLGLIESTKRFLQCCLKIAPTIYSFGNHERGLLESEIEEIKHIGITILDNTWTSHRGLALGGLSSDERTVITDEDRLEFRTNTRLRSNMPFLKKRRLLRNDSSAQKVHWKQSPSINCLDEFESQEMFKILLCHHPEYYEEYLRTRQIDLILSGHAHGGQIRIFNRGLYATGQGILPKYTSGIYDGKFIVSRGLSNTSDIIPRLCNPKELVYVNLIGQGSTSQ